MNLTTREDIQANVSRETFERLEILAALLNKWNPKINLVSKSSLNELWSRHIADSLQIVPMTRGLSGHWVDIGSGGGFPGLVIAATNPEREDSLKLTMVESDVRKCSFLRTVLREMSVDGEVICARIESTPPQKADVLSARALADLSLLFEFSEIHLSTEGTCVFPKGINWKKEILTAEESWSFDYEAIKSSTQDGAVILKVRNLKRV